MSKLRKKAKFDFKAIEKTINYLSLWPSYCNENEEFIDFEEEDGNGNYSIDNCPFSIEEFESKGYTYGGSIYAFSTLYGEEGETDMHINFYPKDNLITFLSDKFSYKECVTIINMVMAQINADEKNRSYCLYFGIVGDNESWKGYHHDATHSGFWWDEFVQMFSECKDDINRVEISLSEKEDGEGEIFIELYYGGE